MSKAKKITVETSRGTFTRTTARTYTYIVVGRWDQEAARLAAETMNKRELENAQENFTYYAQLVSRGPGEHDVGQWEAAKDLIEDGFAAYVERRRQDKIERHEEAVARGQYGFTAFNWCGRLDLAQKEAARLIKRGVLDVEIFPVA